MLTAIIVDMKYHTIWYELAHCLIWLNHIKWYGKLNQLMWCSVSGKSDMKDHTVWYDWIVSDDMKKWINWYGIAYQKKVICYTILFDIIESYQMKWKIKSFDMKSWIKLIFKLYWRRNKSEEQPQWVMIKSLQYKVIMKIIRH